MELPLQLVCNNISWACFWKVSILVLMELPLQQILRNNIMSFLTGFNPCFNGTTSATLVVGGRTLGIACFNPCFNGTTSATNLKRRKHQRSKLVSILVLMELPLQPQMVWLKLKIMFRFNPCFNGTTSATNSFKSGLFWCCEGFNPCFNGTTSATQDEKKISKCQDMFQSLF